MRGKKDKSPSKVVIFIKKDLFYLRELVLETNRKMEQNNNIITGQKSKNWDLIKQKITTAKV